MDIPYFLLKALALAQIKRGFCAPNPAVGAIVVNPRGDVIATGYHHGPGQPHAEVDALAQLTREETKGATVFVTLEPCCHWGRTPPCTDALIKAEVSRVIYGFIDPNPLIAGKSKVLLNQAGIECEYYALPEITEFYHSYQYWLAHKKPVITTKIALSLDGKIANSDGEPIALTGAELKELTYRCRKQSDAILTTAKTILCDNPQLNIRNEDTLIAKPIYILDRQLQIPLDAKIFMTAQSVTIFYATPIADKLAQLKQKNARCIAVTAKQQYLDWSDVIKQIGEDGVQDLWVEAGGTCFSTLLAQELLHKAYIYLAPCWIGAGQMAFQGNFSLNLSTANVAWQQMGNDAVCKLSWLR